MSGWGCQWGTGASDWKELSVNSEAAHELLGHLVLSSMGQEEPGPVPGKLMQV